MGTLRSKSAATSPGSRSVLHRSTSQRLTPTSPFCPSWPRSKHHLHFYFHNNTHTHIHTVQYITMIAALSLFSDSTTIIKSHYHLTYLKVVTHINSLPITIYK